MRRGPGGSSPRASRSDWGPGAKPRAARRLRRRPRCKRLHAMHGVWGGAPSRAKPANDVRLRPPITL